MRRLHVQLSPAEVDTGPEPGKVYLPVDVLRATTCMVKALASDALDIYPFESAYSLELFAGTLDKASFRVAHESDCVRQEGADFGNSPAEYSQSTCGGRRILMVTSNGAPLVKALEGAEHLLVLSFANLSVTADYLNALDGEAVVVCAGWLGSFALEDTLCAGALAQALCDRDPGLELTEAAKTAKTLFEGVSADLPAAVARTEAGARLIELGFEEDVAFCAQRDTLPVVVLAQGMPMRLVAHGRSVALTPIDPPETMAEKTLEPDSSDPTPPQDPNDNHGAGDDGGDDGGQGDPEGSKDPEPRFRIRSMSLGDHLVELRRKLIFSVIIVLAAFVVTFLFSQPVVDFLLLPVDRAFTSVARADVARMVEKKGEKMPVGKELAERILTQKGGIIAFKPEEVFLGYLKVSLIVAIFLSSPLWMWQLWSFIAVGLYSSERRYIYFFAPAVYFFFTSGVLFLYFIVLPLGLTFLLGFGEHPLIGRTVAFGSYMNFCLLLSLMMGLVFQTPLVMLFLTKIGLVRPATFAARRKHVLLGTFILAAIITPPDVVTQILLAIPLMGLYELGIFLSRFAFTRKEKARTAQGEES